MTSLATLLTINQAKTNFKTLKNTFQQDLNQINRGLYQSIQSDDDKIQQLANWIKEAPGKQFRPLLTLIAAQAFGRINQEVYDYAIATELVHNASLVHDDILDKSAIRRGNPTPHQLWGEHQAILLGDFLFSIGYRHVLKTSDPICRDDLPKVASKMCESELLQSAIKFSKQPSRKNYYRVIDGKTAFLFGIACAAGTKLAGGSQLQKNKMEKAGNAIGRAFQIMDDWLDFFKAGSADEKPRGLDIECGIFTLPIIILLEECSEEESVLIQKIIFKAEKAGISTPIIHKLTEKYDIAEKTLTVALSFIKEAENIFISCQPNDTTHFFSFINSIVVSGK